MVQKLRDVVEDREPQNQNTDREALNLNVIVRRVDK